MKILVVDDDKDIREVVEFSLKCEVKCEITQAESGMEAIKLLEQGRSFDLVVCDYNMNNGNGGDVYLYMCEQNITAPFVLCSSDDYKFLKEFKDKTIFGQITKPFVYEGVEEIIKKIDGKFDSNTEVKKVNSNCLTVGIDLLLKTQKLPCDIYIELDNAKILKMYNKGEVFSIEEYNKYSEKGLTYLHIKRGDKKIYAEDFCNNIIEKLLDKNSPIEDRVYDAHETIMIVIKELGLTEKIIRSTNSSVDSALELFSNNSDFLEIEQKIFKGPKNYLTVHCIASSYIAVAILNATKWTSRETKNKVVLAGFLHDISIRDLDTNGVEINSENEYINFKEHPLEAYEALSRLESIPVGVGQIVLEHHEKSDGSGFPKRLDGTQIHPLSCVFILAHDIAEVILDLKAKGAKITHLAIKEQILLENYSIGHFLKCYEAFSKADIFNE